MSSALVKKAIQRFLENSTPQVLCIRGKWGVGKTYIWEQIFKQAKAEEAVALPYYCYVSLFGLQSIDEVRQTIFENRVTTKEIEIEPTLESLKHNLRHYGETVAKNVSKYSPFAKVPFMDNYIANFSGGFRQVVSLAVRDTIICFDDFERKKLSAKDLLGLISQFREQRRCKAVIILNDDALSKEEKDDFDKYFEKVVDIPIEFSPTPSEAADIAIASKDEISERLKENTTTLGISNIRVIGRIKEVGADLIALLDSFGVATKFQALHTLTLFVWSKYDSEAIPKELIWGQRTRQWQFLEQKERTEQEKKWLPVLEKYKFGSMDDFDAVIAGGVEKGFFDREKLIAEAKNQDERQKEAAAREAIGKAWKFFHGSFEDNVAKVVEVVSEAYKAHSEYASIGNLDEAACMFRKFGYGEVASGMINSYMSIHSRNIKIVDDPSRPFHPVIKDEEFRAALTAAITPGEPRSAKEILADIYQGRVSPQESECVMRLSTDELYELFKGLKGEELYPVIEGSLFYRRVGNATDEQTEFTQRSLAALEKIGKESELNAIRVQKFGVIMDANKSQLE